MDYSKILAGREEPLPVFSRVLEALDNFEEFPFLLEPIYREASELGDDDLDRLRFGLVRLQVYADIHRYEDMEAAQRMKYVAATIERVLFGRLLLEGEEAGGKQCC
ncbi:hypothetical protein FKB36_01615 [Methanoculleus sp. Afa-1]|uniref:Uncharacterized protein n=1 Tax=Methanoculleus formosensis TaxID=2590886 RepID=A0A9E4ZIR3_9EURY|nr:hypothetical protein [Methanoculleus sp. Afa-1]MCT8336228.1 hypothetical protein [Methanoculleus sp. Afa-1]